jgi:WD40 repeat protein
MLKTSFLVFASCYDGSIYEFQRDMPEGPRRAFQGHELKGNGNNLVKIAVSPDGKYLLSGSTDGCPRIYPLEEPILDEYPRTYPIVRSLKGKSRV